MASQLPPNPQVSPAQPLPPASLVGTNVDRYEVFEQLGQGGFAAVYRARHQILGTEVALKVLWPDQATDSRQVSRFLQEARAVARVGNPHIIKVSDAGTTPEGLVFLAMELLRGGDLRAELSRRQKIPLSEILSIADQLLLGLHAAHEQGVIHRDLKPANVFLVDVESGPRRVMLLDFGISKIVGSRTLTATGVVMGTPHYMPPEQILGHKADRRSDVYALGVLLYEALSGRLPFEGRGYDVMVRRVQGEQATPLAELLPDLPRPVTDVIHRALATDPDARFQDAVSMAAALAAAGRGVRMISGLETGPPNSGLAALALPAAALSGAALSGAASSVAERADAVPCLPEGYMPPEAVALELAPTNPSVRPDALKPTDPSVRSAALKPSAGDEEPGNLPLGMGKIPRNRVPSDLEIPDVQVGRADDTVPRSAEFGKKKRPQSRSPKALASTSVLPESALPSNLSAPPSGRHAKASLARTSVLPEMDGHPSADPRPSSRVSARPSSRVSARTSVLPNGAPQHTGGRPSARSKALRAEPRPSAVPPSPRPRIFLAGSALLVVGLLMAVGAGALMFAALKFSRVGQSDTTPIHPGAPNLPARQPPPLSPSPVPVPVPIPVQGQPMMPMHPEPPVADRGVVTLGGDSLATEAPTAEASPPEEASSEASEVPSAEALSPEALSPEALSPEALSPEALSPEALSPEALSPEALSPEALSPEALSPEAPSVAPSTEAPSAEEASSNAGRVQIRLVRYHSNVSRALTLAMLEGASGQLLDCGGASGSRAFVDFIVSADRVSISHPSTRRTSDELRVARCAARAIDGRSMDLSGAPSVIATAEIAYR